MLYRAVAPSPKELAKAWDLALAAASRDLNNVARDGRTLVLPVRSREYRIPPPRGTEFAIEMAYPEPRVLAVMMLMKFWGSEVELRTQESLRSFAGASELLQPLGYPVDPWWALERATLLLADRDGKRYVVEVLDAEGLTEELALTEAMVAELKDPKILGPYNALPDGRRVTNSVWELTESGVK